MSNKQQEVNKFGMPTIGEMVEQESPNFQATPTTVKMIVHEDFDCSHATRSVISKVHASHLEGESNVNEPLTPYSTAEPGYPIV